MNINNLKQLSRCGDLVIRKLEDEFYLISSYGTYAANEIGATIVNAVGRDLSIDDLCLKLTEKYSDCDIDQIRSDVNTYISFLVSEGVLSCE